MESVIEIGPLRLLAAFAFVIILLFMVRGQNIGKEKEIIISTFRMTFQLVAVGYILVYIFNNEHWAISVLVFTLMLFFSVRNIYARVEIPINAALRRLVLIAMVSGATFTTAYFLLIVLNNDPWYDPRYFIPITGMIIGNSMTGIALGVERLAGEMESKKALVEGALMLGATSREATSAIVQDSFTAAIMPTINSMVGMGIVFLPGMMTGQILAGLSPLTAIEYQIAIMLAILGSVSITLFILSRYGYQTFFTARSQLLNNNLIIGERR